MGGSYAGLAAGLALGRALRKVLIIDSGNPCNKQTPYSYNFLTNDGEKPKAIASLAKQQVSMYGSVTFLDALATAGIYEMILAVWLIVKGFNIRYVTRNN